jgi:hypothetical protein
VFRTLTVLASFALFAPACGHDIGDSCSTNVDCAQDGTRDCDLSQPGGYCTVAGCDEKSCPGEAVCIRIFPFLSPGTSCSPETPCVSSEICLPDGFCVPRDSERRFCEKKCGSNGDCRGGYVCREAGIETHPPYGSLVAGIERRPADQSTYGSIALVANANQSTMVKFCAPKP